MAGSLQMLKWALTLGREPQDFLGARWVPVFLSRLPERSKRKWALRLLALSPHYFIHPEHSRYEGMSTGEYLEKVFDDLLASRRRIYQHVLRPRVPNGSVVVDFGCGPGFLSRAASPDASRIYAVDRSRGAIACARILNPDKKITYIEAAEEGRGDLPDATADVVIAYALVQHLTKDALAELLRSSHFALRPAGSLLAHVQTETTKWKPESEWSADRSVRGRMKYRFGLHCFGRPLREYERMLDEAGFIDIRFERIDLMLEEDVEPLEGQYLATARKPDAV